MNYGTPIGGSISGTGTFGGYGGILAALMQHYGQGMGQPQQQPEVDETELARMLGLIPGGQRGASPQPHPGQPYPGGQRMAGGPVMQIANQGIGLGR
jgi:hypothetical protein